MKIETTKNFAANKNAAAKPSSGEAAANANGADDSGSNSSDFASVLNNLNSKPKTAEPKTADSPKPADRDDKTERKSENKQTTETAHKNRKDEQPRDDAAAAFNARATSGSENSINETEASVPPARQILHIADLERIVSGIRTNTFENSRQIEITLKNSVFDGLKIKITADDNQRITAEFIAGSEKVKAQLDARSGELADVLRQRGVKLNLLQTSVGSDASGGNQKNGYEDLAAVDALSNSKTERTISAADEADEIIVEANETAGHTYRV